MDKIKEFFSIKRKYFISFSLNTDSGYGFGNLIYHCKGRILKVESRDKIQKKIKESFEGIKPDNVIILFFHKI